MRELAAEVFGVDKGRVLLSPQPETTVGSGLAVYRVLEYRNGQKRRKLHEELPDYKRRFEADLTLRIDRFAEEAAAAVMAPLKAHVEGVYLDWYRNGGTLKDVQQKVESFTAGFDVAACLQGRDALLAQDLLRLVRDHLDAWIKEHGIDRDADELAPDGAIDGLKMPRVDDQAGAIARVISDLVGVALVGAVFSIVYVAVHGAHILVHPLTGLPTALFSALATAVGFTLIEDRVRSAVMAYNWGSVSLKALSLRLSEKGLRDEIAKNCDKAASEIARLLRHGPKGPEAAASGDSNLPPPSWETLDQLQHTVVARFEQTVAQAIRDLGILEEIRKASR
jgi:hypothetical protein